MKPALLGFLFCATLAAQPASMEGTVLNQATGQPLAGVHVRLVTGDFTDSGADQIVYGAISDRAGHFSVTNMKPGIYVVIPERAGFVAAPSAKPATPVTFVPLKPGQQLAGYKLEMTPHATISGRVVDEYGDPVQRVAVQLEPVAGSAQIDPFAGWQSNSTDDRGEFHMVAAPGRYYLKAPNFPDQHEYAPEIRTDGTSAAPYAATYYPSAASTSAASIVQAAPGQDIAGLEIRLTRGVAAAGAAGTLTISGIVTGAPENAMVNVFLRHGESPDQMYDSEGRIAGRDGKFVFRGLQPGSYRLSAHYSSGKTHLLSQPVALTLGSSDQTDLELVLAPAEEITGTLEITGDAPPAAAAEKRTVRLDPAFPFDTSGNPETTPGAVDPKGAFRIGNVAPGRFVPVVDPLPENAYIQSVTLDNRPAADNILDLSRGIKGSHIKITVSRDGAQVSGTVLDKDGQPLLSPLDMVFLVTDPKQLREMQPDNQHRVTEGKYMIKAIRPGKYRLFALDVLTLASDAPDADSDDDELMKSFFNSAEEIEIKPGDRIVKDLKAIDKLPGKEPHAAP
jgi:protocatechuate 3,4-dioxygenase beta subunit